jgi:hypothetical protein
MSRNLSSYVYLKTFGDHPPSANNDPLSYFIGSQVDSRFQHGNYQRLDATSPQAGAYMAQRCSAQGDSWDGYCEYFYQTNGPQNSNRQLYPNQLFGDTAYTLQTSQLSPGDQLVKNASNLRFCSFDGCEKKCEPFDPMDPNSPIITQYVGQCLPIANRIDPATIDNDPLMNKVLLNPRINPELLINACNTSRRNGVNLKGTKLGQVCDIYYANMDKQ